MKQVSPAPEGTLPEGVAEPKEVCVAKRTPSASVLTGAHIRSEASDASGPVENRRFLKEQQRRRCCGVKRASSKTRFGFSTDITDDGSDFLKHLFQYEHVYETEQAYQ